MMATGELKPKAKLHVLFTNVLNFMITATDQIHYNIPLTKISVFSLAAFITLVQQFIVKLSLILDCLIFRILFQMYDQRLNDFKSE